MFPSLAPYHRGFGGTILRYEDRSYEGSSWERIKEFDSLSEVGSDGTALYSVSGWDDESIWIANEYGQLFRCLNGHWSVAAALPSHLCYRPVLRVLSREVLLASGGHQHVHAYRVSDDGIADLGETSSWGGQITEICPISDDLFYFLGRDDFRGGAYKFSDDKLTDLRLDKYKEALVHRPDNTPLRAYPIRRLQDTATPIRGKAFGVARPETITAEANKIVYFENGIWYATDFDLPGGAINDTWFGANGAALQFAVTVGDRGNVFVHQLRGPGVRRPVTTSQESTTFDLFRVWGVNPEKYWVMDRSGTVWEYNGSAYQVVVRGLHREDVSFIDAWVSPTGTIYGITDKRVYRLK
jgi:hypothetical protein